MKHKHILLIILLLVGVATSSYAVNYAAQFNAGTPNDYISLGVNQYNTLYSGASGATIEGWIKPASLANSRVFHTGIDAAGTTQFAMEIETDGRLTVYARSNATDTAEFATTAAGTIATGNWYHFALVVSYASGNKYIRLYLNGNPTPAAANNSPVFASTTYTSGTPSSTNIDVLGRYLATILRPYVGLMEEFRYWKYARSITEIQADMVRELPTPYPSSLIGYWNFNTGS